MTRLFYVSFNAWKVSVFGVFLVRVFSPFRIQSDCGKIRTRKTPNTDTFYAVIRMHFSEIWLKSFFKKNKSHKIHQLQVYVVTVTLHLVQITLQQYLKWQRQSLVTFLVFILYPLLQHNTSQLPGPVPLLLHVLPFVPRLPTDLLWSQNWGLSSEYTKSFFVGYFIVSSYGTRFLP